VNRKDVNPDEKNVIQRADTRHKIQQCKYAFGETNTHVAYEIGINGVGVNSVCQFPGINSLYR